MGPFEPLTSNETHHYDTKRPRLLARGAVATGGQCRLTFNRGRSWPWLRGWESAYPLDITYSLGRPKSGTAKTKRATYAPGPDIRDRAAHATPKQDAHFPARSDAEAFHLCRGLRVVRAL